jgi:hypothetical protein
MATQHKKIGKHTEDNKGTYLHKDNWEVMKPFVHFAWKAVALVGAALFAIVKLVPRAIEHKPAEQKNNNKIIKI